MRNVSKYLILSAVLLLSVFTTSCTNQSEQAVINKATAITFENGTVKEYNSSDIINPFKNIKVRFSGKAGKGTATIDTSNCEAIVKDNFTFICENDGNLINGNKAIIKAIYDAKAFKNSGYTITDNEKSYIVTGVDLYPSAIKNYEKDTLNSSVRKLADKYIEDNIQTMDMEYDSGKNRSGWSKSGSFEYTYNYHDRIMIYNYNRDDHSKNAYFIIYELSNEINCTEDMTTGENPMNAGESDMGWAYIVAGASHITATSNMIFNNDFNKKEASELSRSFKTYKEAIEYCTYGDGYITLREAFT